VFHAPETQQINLVRGVLLRGHHIGSILTLRSQIVRGRCAHKKSEASNLPPLQGETASQKNARSDKNLPTFNLQPLTFTPRHSRGRLLRQKTLAVTRTCNLASVTKYSPPASSGDSALRPFGKVPATFAKLALRQAQDRPAPTGFQPAKAGFADVAATLVAG
jgi:hypothetical protein